MSRKKTAPAEAAPVTGVAPPAKPVQVAAAVTAPTASAPHGDVMQLVTFLLGDDEYGFHIDRVQEIIQFDSVHITAIPNAPAMIEGVINLRGRLVPTVDLRKRFDRPSDDNGRATRIVVVNVASRTIGLVVDAVLEVAKVGTLDIEPLPELATGIDSEFVEGVCRTPRGLVVLLDLERMFSEQETAAIEELAE